MLVVLRKDNKREYGFAIQIQLADNGIVNKEVIQFCEGRIEPRTLHNDKEPSLVAVWESKNSPTPILLKVGEYLLKSKEGIITPCSVEMFHKDYIILENYLNSLEEIIKN